MQTALEYEASALQAYRVASMQVDAALKDARVTAAIEQTADPSTLPPAVVLDIDETVLDNSYYLARQVRDRSAFTAETWDRWCQEARATPIPGAVAFTQEAAKRGVTVFYVTNRTSNVEEATRRNLAAHAFPLDSRIDTVLTRGERPEWQASTKAPRRAHIARDYRILLLVGDDLGDFIADASGTPAQRSARTAPQSGWWGQRWIMLPNPTYGSWERAISGTASDPISAKRAALKYESPIPHP
jgi:5'-nucleotidase (lipoprotein e(P4) family)